jgi:hypothetical protein
MLIPYLIQSLNDPKVLFSLRRYELQILTPRSDVASRKVDYVLDLGTVCQLVHCGYDR